MFCKHFRLRFVITEKEAKGNMDIQNELRLSYYAEIGALNEEHKVMLVQHKETKQIFVKKTMLLYDKSVYEYLREHHIQGTPFIHEVISDGSALVVIEELVSGENLKRILEKSGAMPEKKVEKYALQLCEILSSLHSAEPPIIHRDIKPDNIIITPSDNVVLIDLNAAKRAGTDDSKTEDTVLLGTKGYAAPEQYGFGTSNVQADIYAVGMLINTMVHGEYSRDVKTCVLSDVIGKCIRLDPEERYRSVNELKNAILKTAEGGTDVRRFLPPGFRTGNPIHMLVAVAYYLFSVMVVWDMEFKNSDRIETVIERVASFFIFMAVAFCTCDYGGIQKKIFLCRSENPILRAVGVLLLNFTAVAVVVLVAIILCML